MARQSTTPVQFNLTTRVDSAVTMTSGRAGRCQMLGFFPLLPGDSASGKVGVDLDLAEMPRPLLNGVDCNFQAWFVPKSSHPQFAGMDEFIASFQEKPIDALGQAQRTPPPFFETLSGANVTTAAASEFFKDLGLHIPAGATINADLIDAFSVIYNFRLAAHSSRLARRPYAREDLAAALTWPRAFWPSGRFSRVVPDYERALVVGALDLDVSAGRLPVSGVGTREMTPTWETGNLNSTGGLNENTSRAAAYVKRAAGAFPAVFAEMQGQTVGVTLADIDKARVTQSFAKLRAAYAGNDATGFANDDAIVAHLMQGLSVPENEFKRPWLLDSKRVPVGFAERHATNGSDLDKSVTKGRASAVLSVNVPRNDVGGLVIYTVEVLPERLYERQSDEWLLCTQPNAYPNALRDIQRPEPVDLVPNRRVDAKHKNPGALYGYEPMNDSWNREFTRLGGSFYQATPGAPWTEQRSAIWTVDVVDPAFNSEHYLAPATFPHGVFADTTKPAFEVVARHNVSIVGLTQIGDILAENSDDYTAVQGAA